jgi:hypothetical protein
MSKKVNDIAKQIINEFPSWNELLNHALEVDKNFYKIVVYNSIENNLHGKTEVDILIPELRDLIHITNHIGKVMVDYPAFNDSWIVLDTKTKLPKNESYGIAVDAYGDTHKVNGYEMFALLKVYLTTWLKHPKYNTKLDKLRIKFSYSTETLSRITN